MRVLPLLRPFIFQGSVLVEPVWGTGCGHLPSIRADSLRPHGSCVPRSRPRPVVYRRICALVSKTASSLTGRRLEGQCRPALQLAPLVMDPNRKKRAQSFGTDMHGLFLQLLRRDKEFGRNSEKTCGFGLDLYFSDHLQDQPRILHSLQRVDAPNFDVAHAC